MLVQYTSESTFRCRFYNIGANYQSFTTAPSPTTLPARGNGNAPVISPDGEILLFHSGSFLPSLTAYFYDGATFTVLTGLPSSSTSYPVHLSNTQAIFVDGVAPYIRLYERQLDNNFLETTGVLDTAPLAAQTRGAMSPSGNLFVSSGTGSGDIHFYAFNGSNFTKLVPDTLPTAFTRDIRISPDGKWISIRCWGGTGATHTIWRYKYDPIGNTIVNVDTLISTDASGIARNTVTERTFPVFSPTTPGEESFYMEYKSNIVDQPFEIWSYTDNNMVHLHEGVSPKLYPKITTVDDHEDMAGLFMLGYDGRTLLCGPNAYNEGTFNIDTHFRAYYLESDGYTTTPDVVGGNYSTTGRVVLHELEVDADLRDSFAYYHHIVPLPPLV